MSDLIEITEDNFMGEVLDSQLPVLVDCWAAWCGPCRMLAPEIEAVAQAEPERLKVVKMDTDANPGLSQLLAVSLLPTMVLFVDGVIQTSIAGYRTRDYILEHIGPFLKSPARGKGANG